MKKKLDKIPEELKKFLKSKRAYGKFCKNLCYIDETDSYTMYNGFIWDHSPEGHNFWDKLNDEYGK